MRIAMLLNDTILHSIKKGQLRLGNGLMSPAGLKKILGSRRLVTLRPGSNAVLHMSRIECKWGRSKGFLICTLFGSCEVQRLTAAWRWSIGRKRVAIIFNSFRPSTVFSFDILMVKYQHNIIYSWLGGKNKNGSVAQQFTFIPTLNAISYIPLLLW